MLGGGIEMSKILVYSLVTIILLSAIHEVVFAEDEMYVMFVASEPKYANNLAYHTITTEIYSSVYYPAVVTIYVEDADMTPLGVMIFKTTLLEGITPIEFGFTEPIECSYNTLDHKPICNTDTPNKIYVNIFTDSSLTVPIVQEGTI